MRSNSLAISTRGSLLFCNKQGGNLCFFLEQIPVNCKMDPYRSPLFKVVGFNFHQICQPPTQRQPVGDLLSSTIYFSIKRDAPSKVGYGVESVRNDIIAKGLPRFAYSPFPPSSLKRNADFCFRIAAHFDQTSWNWVFRPIFPFTRSLWIEKMKKGCAKSSPNCLRFRSLT